MRVCGAGIRAVAATGLFLLGRVCEAGIVHNVQDPVRDYCNEVAPANEDGYLTTGSSLLRLDVPIGDNDTTVILLASTVFEPGDRGGERFIAYVPGKNGYTRYPETPEGDAIRIRLDAFNVCLPDGVTTGPSYLISALRASWHGYWVQGGTIHSIWCTVGEKALGEQTTTGMSSENKTSRSRPAPDRLLFSCSPYQGAERFPVVTTRWEDLPMDEDSIECITERERIVHSSE